jgi:serine/threonine protein phosphatase 1
MATVAIGDIHGNLPALLDVLGQIRGEVAEGDVVVFLGDYIDRGPASRGCVDAILEFRRDSAADVVCLLGNHEDWLQRAQEDHTNHSWLLGMDGLDTVVSYSAEAGHRMYEQDCAIPYDVFFDTLPAPHRAFFAGLILSFQSPDCICTHAGVNPRLAGLADQPRRALIWGDAAFPAEYRGETPVVYGHWNNADLDAEQWPRPRIAGNTIGIDTVSHGVLTAIRMPDRRVFQSGRHNW